MNITKMRHQIRRVAPLLCNSRYLPGPGKRVEICTLPVGHQVPHNWPSIQGNWGKWAASLPGITTEQAVRGLRSLP